MCHPRVKLHIMAEHGKHIEGRITVMSHLLGFATTFQSALRPVSPNVLSSGRRTNLLFSLGLISSGSHFWKSRGEVTSPLCTMQNVWIQFIAAAITRAKPTVFFSCIKPWWPRHKINGEAIINISFHTDVCSVYGAIVYAHVVQSISLDSFHSLQLTYMVWYAYWIGVWWQPLGRKAATVVLII